MMPEGGPPSASGADWDDEQAQALKRPRLVWTPQLHKRFVDAVNQLGIKNAVPKTIMQVCLPPFGIADTSLWLFACRYNIP